MPEATLEDVAASSSIDEDVWPDIGSVYVTGKPVFTSCVEDLPNARSGDFSTVYHKAWQEPLLHLMTLLFFFGLGTVPQPAFCIR